MFLLLPNSASNIQIDEINYASLATWIADGNDSSKYPNYPTLYLTSKTLIYPASRLVLLGVSGLDAVRIISSIYGLLSLLLICFAILNIFSSLNDVTSKTNSKLITVLFALYAFLPSHFAWSIVGIKESSNEFWLISTFWCLLLLYRSRSKNKVYTLVILGISIVCTFSTRPQVGWVLAI